MKENVKPSKWVTFPGHLSFQYKYIECLIYARHCSRSWADGSTRQVLILMEPAFQRRESEKANRCIMHFQVAIQDMKTGGGQGLRVLWPSVRCVIPSSAFNPHEDIKVMNTLRLADSWPALWNWLQWKHPIPNQKKIAFSHWGHHQLERLEQRIPWKLSSEVT